MATTLWMKKTIHYPDLFIPRTATSILQYHTLESYKTLTPLLFLTQLQAGIIHKMVDIVHKYGVGKAHRLCVVGNYFLNYIVCEEPLSVPKNIINVL